jgi:hypothetical protein
MKKFDRNNEVCGGKEKRIKKNRAAIFFFLPFARRGSTVDIRNGEQNNI